MELIKFISKGFSKLGFYKGNTGKRIYRYRGNVYKTNIKLTQIEREEKENYKENVISIFYNPKPLLKETDYRNYIVNPLKEEEIKFFVSLFKHNTATNFNLFFSKYNNQDENWETTDNKACYMKVSKTGAMQDTIALSSPFIRINGRNFFNTMIIDIDFPTLKDKPDELLKKAEELGNYFVLLEKSGLDIFVPNFIVYTSKGFQLSYVFKQDIYGKERHDLLAYIDAKNLKMDMNTYLNLGLNVRDSAEKLEKLFNATYGALQFILSNAFGGDKYALQSFTIGRVVRNPLANVSTFISIEKKDLFTAINKVKDFIDTHIKIIQEYNPFEKEEVEIVKEVKKLKEVRTDAFFVKNKTLNKQALKEFPISINNNKQDYFDKYKFLNEREEKLVKYCIFDLDLPAINFELTDTDGFRNSYIFSYIKEYAYNFKAIYLDKTDYAQLRRDLKILANFINRNFKLHLDDGELERTINSIIRFVKKRYNAVDIINRNRKLAQRKSLQTKLKLGQDIINKRTITIKRLKNMTLKQIAKITRVSYSTLKRYGKDKVITIIKELMLAINNKTFNVFNIVEKQKLINIYPNVEGMQPSIDINITIALMTGNIKERVRAMLI